MFTIVVQTLIRSSLDINQSEFNSEVAKKDLYICLVYWVLLVALYTLTSLNEYWQINADSYSGW